jgi:hypothetical protein
MYITIPKEGVNAEIKQQVESLLPEPLEVAGWKFNGYGWHRLDQIKTKDEDGNDDNTVRIAGTGENDVLRNSLRKGLDNSKLTPSLLPNGYLLDGFNRLKNLQKEQYQEWIFAEYEIDESTKTEFQNYDKEYVDDFRAASNGGDGAKVITKDELIELGRKRFEFRVNRGKKAVARWVHSLDLNLSKDQVNGIAQTVSKDFARRGIIQSYSRQEAEDKVKKLGTGAHVLNTKDPTRVLRMIPQCQRHYINTGKTYEFITFHSDATTHNQVDEKRIETMKELMEKDELNLRYAAARTGIEFKTLKAMAETRPSPFECIGHLSQKIGVEKEGPDGLAIDMK